LQRLFRPEGMRTHVKVRRRQSAVFLHAVRIAPAC
jgi:hypothetical protein